MSFSPCILYRPGLSDAQEESCARQHFLVYGVRAEIPAGSLVVPRYSALPFMHELERDVHLLGSRLVNSFQHHLYVANFDYYEDLKDSTFRTWFRLQDVPSSMHKRAFVVKGRTNSKKFEWATRMYAEDFRAAAAIAYELSKDGLIGQQGVLIREYEPLETFELSVTGLPFTNEWRLFYYRGERLAHGYYWGGIDDWTPVRAAEPDFLANGLPFSDAIARQIADKVPFVCLDVAKTVEGRWRLVELNDGCQSGLNMSVPADVLYRNLRTALERHAANQVPAPEEASTNA